jgi:broad specificity phosphatase PhoE
METEPGEEFAESGEEFPQLSEEFPESGEEFPQPGAEFPEPGGQRSATGEPRVDAALARLDELAGLPVTEHQAVFEDVHRRLREVLGELDTRQPLLPREAAGPGSRTGR